MPSANLPLSDYTKTFLKDWERLIRTGRFDMNRLKEVMLLLIANDGPLGPGWADHPLKGSKFAYRECRVGGDFLLMYCIEATPPAPVQGPGGYWKVVPMPGAVICMSSAPEVRTRSPLALPQMPWG